MDLDLRLPVDIEHLAVLLACHAVVEPQADALGALCDRIAGLPTEMVDRTDQHIAQNAVFAVDAPRLAARGAAAFAPGP